MKLFSVTIFIILVAIALSKADAAGKAELKIETTFKPARCTQFVKNGDKVFVHYEGKLTNGKVFDSSFKRGEPIDFTLGTGKVIKGWDQGILGMCRGEKRTLTIPPHLGYGASGAGDAIPPDSTLIFRTQLMDYEDSDDEF